MCARPATRDGIQRSVVGNVSVARKIPLNVSIVPRYGAKRLVAEKRVLILVLAKHAKRLLKEHIPAGLFIAIFGKRALA
jgi:hypothetical protein